MRRAQAWGLLTLLVVLALTRPVPAGDSRMILWAGADATNGMLLIEGWNLPEKMPVVALGEYRLAVDRFSPTEIVARLPANLPPASYLVVVGESEHDEPATFVVS